eukprot:11514369-Prorocentrum_lima.AAC.1
MKRRATFYMIHAGMPLKFRCWAACQVAYMYRVRALGIQMPDGVPTFWTQGDGVKASARRGTL